MLIQVGYCIFEERKKKSWVSKLDKTSYIKIAVGIKRTTEDQF